MAIQKILTIPNPILREKAKAVARIDKKKLAIIQDLKDTLADQKKPQGVGLAAPQIGKSVRICLVYSKASRKFLTLINPEILWKSKRLSTGVPGSKNPYEGCLSVPGIWGQVKRHKQVKVRYLAPTNQTVVRKFSGLTGVVAQHEIDHLAGILFLDRVLEQKGKIFRIKKDQSGKEILEEVKIM